MALPVDGQTNWGDPLNADINALQSQANGTQTSLTNHGLNNPPDPHGDRSYAQSLVTPITSGTNAPNGYVKLNGSGRIIASQITGLGGPGGIYTAVFDAVATYGMTTGNNDSSAACQSACNAASSAGGGIVWIGPGSFSFTNFVFIPSNVWIMMSEGTVINRKSGGVAPSYLFTNVKFDGVTSPSSNIRITGGKIDATANGLTSACTPIFIIQSGHTIIEDCRIFNVVNNPAIELNGCFPAAFIRNVKFSGNDNTSANTAPAIRINFSSSSTTPAGLLNTLYNQAICQNVAITGCTVDPPVHYGAYSAIAGSDLITGTQQLSGPFHTGITITGCTYPTSNANNKILSTIVSNSVWQAFNIAGNSLPEISNGWFQMTLSNGWTNSGSGPNAQWRFVTTGGGASMQIIGFNYPVADSIEIIGDVTAGTVTNGTTIWSFPNNNLYLNSNQIVPVTFTSGSYSVPNGARLFFIIGSPPTLQVQSMAGAGGLRMFFHSIISLTA